MARRRGLLRVPDPGRHRDSGRQRGPGRHRGSGRLFKASHDPGGHAQSRRRSGRRGARPASRRRVERRPDALQDPEEPLAEGTEEKMRPVCSLPNEDRPMTTVVSTRGLVLRMRNASCPDRVEPLLLPLSKAVGRVTARTVWAPRSSPPFDASAMDGIAVRASDTTGARDCAPLLIPEGAFEVIDTGDPLPGAFDAVVMREHVRFTNEGAELRAEVASTRTCGRSARTSSLTSSSSSRVTDYAQSTSPPAVPRA